ncbi:MAG TPA: hypothetical protein VK154_03205 [Chitinophagales bacterium]|nr:hypothetical protein [Chitinophagales bacterium]
MTTLDVLKKIKLDLRKGCIEPDQWVQYEHDFEISPRDFLKFSKQDFKTNDKRGNINALTNAKRAIDCQTERILYSIGIDPKQFSNTIVEKFIQDSRNAPKKDLPIRLRLLQALGFAPAAITAGVRNLRHDVEHFYKKPTNDQVSNAIELAELFIQATDSKLRTMTHFYISDTDKKLKSDGHVWNSLHIEHTPHKNLFTIYSWLEKTKLKRIIIKNDTEEYLYLVKIAALADNDEDVEDALKDWIKFINHPIPIDNIHFERIF